jgi:PAS domain-containing protein
MRFWDSHADATTASTALPIERLVTEMEILGALRFDGAGRVLSCNATMARWLGASPAEVSGASLDAVLEPKDAAAMLALVRSGRAHVAGRVRLAFLGRVRGPFVLECAVALDAGGGALLGGRGRDDEERDSP